MTADLENRPKVEDLDEIREPEKKKLKTASSTKQMYKLEERLNCILCCAVCLDMPSVAVFQVSELSLRQGVFVGCNCPRSAEYKQ